MTLVAIGGGAFPNCANAHNGTQSVTQQKPDHDVCGCNDIRFGDGLYRSEKRVDCYYGIRCCARCVCWN